MRRRRKEESPNRKIEDVTNPGVANRVLRRLRLVVVHVVVIDQYLLRFDDSMSEQELRLAQHVGEADEVSPREVALACGAIDVVERPRFVHRDGVPGVEWSVWARSWGEQGPLVRAWYGVTLTAKAVDALEPVLRTSQAAAYEASLALELAGILQRDDHAAHPGKESRRRRP